MSARWYTSDLIEVTDDEALERAGEIIKSRVRSAIGDSFRQGRRRDEEEALTDVEDPEGPCPHRTDGGGHWWGRDRCPDAVTYCVFCKGLKP